MAESRSHATFPPPSFGGPFRADQIRDGDPYELSNGHPLLCMGAGDRHSMANARGVAVLLSDPAVKGQAGVDAGFAFNDGKSLRAPDIAIGNLHGEPGWAKGTPPLAVEYADRGQDEEQLQQKISELIEAGTRFVWVVRLTGPLRVEVYEPRKPVRLVDGEGTLSAPGVLANSYPVRALVDELAARKVTFQNLLQQEGYRSLDEVRAEALRVGIRDACELLGIELTASREAALQGMDLPALDQLRQDLKRLRCWPV